MECVIRGKWEKSLDGRWDRQKKVWLLPYRYVQLLKLEDRVVPSKK